MNWRECIVVGLMGVWLMAAPPSAVACNCVAYSIEALSRVHIHLKTIPSIAENNWYKHAGSYSRGVVNIVNIDNCRVMLHEFVHHWQWLRYGNAQDIHEWQRRENQAAMVTMFAESEMERCP